MKLDLSATFFHLRIPSGFGDMTLFWEETDDGARVTYISLPNEQDGAEAAIRAAGTRASSRSCPAIDDLCQRLGRFLSGEAVDFELELLALERCSEFQRRVLLAESGIPRGRVSTYGRIAAHLNVPGGARAVGGALGRNPFPIVVPCHRAVRSDGGLGGYRGGLAMKRALLEMEGVEISPAGKVLTGTFHYE
jgi:methylated-DNA-[protein]-cysteine S-methyltransferase